MTIQHYFVSGMPRSGSRLLLNILAQNPAFHAGAPSGLLDMLFIIRNEWDGVMGHRIMDEAVSDVKKLDFMRGAFRGYYEDTTDKPFILDWSRGWLAHIEMLEAVIGERVKILVTVRDLREILASMEMLWRNTSRNRQMAQERNFYVEMQTVSGRCAVWMKDEQPVGLAYNRVVDALLRGFGDRFHFVHYERLTADPEATIASVYDFLGVNYYVHDFDNIVQVTSEDDRIHGLPGLHTIRPEVRPQHPKRAILGPVADAYKTEYPWNIK